MKSSNTRGLRLVSRTASSLSELPVTTRPISFAPDQNEDIIAYLLEANTSILMRKSDQKGNNVFNFQRGLY